MRTVIAFGGGRAGIKDFAALRTLGCTVRNFCAAGRAIEHKGRAALGADQIIGLQGRAAGGAAFAATVRANIGVFGHGLLAMWTVFGVVRVALKREAARRALGIEREDGLAAIGARQRPACAAIQARGGAGRNRRVAFRAKFLIAGITDFGVVGQFGITGGAVHRVAS